MKLTPREIQIMYLICEEMTSSQIGKKLFISSRTVEKHTSNIIQKIECKSIIGIVRYAYNNDYLEPIIKEQ